MEREYITERIVYADKSAQEGWIKFHRGKFEEAILEYNTAIFLVQNILPNDASISLRGTLACYFKSRATILSRFSEEKRAETDLAKAAILDKEVKKRTEEERLKVKRLKEAEKAKAVVRWKIWRQTGVL